MYAHTKAVGLDKKRIVRSTCLYFSLGIFYSEIQVIKRVTFHILSLLFFANSAFSNDAYPGRYFRFERLSSNAKASPVIGFFSICQDKEGFLWLGTNVGLARYDGYRFKFFSSSSEAETLLSAIGVYPVTISRSGDIWVGTNGKGLFRFLRETEKFVQYHHDPANPNSLSDDIVLGVQEDSKGALWLSTDRGLSKFNPATGDVTNFGIQDGPQVGFFNLGASLKSADGRMLFGGTNGFNCFNPAEVQKDSFIPPVVWTAFYRNNVEVKLPQSLTTLCALTLPYKTPLATFEFAALCFTAPDMNSFAYRLEPRDSDWVLLGTDNKVSLSDLGAGQYTLHMRAANPDGIWNEEGIIISVKVLPPFWRTWWFLMIAALLLVSGIISLVTLWRKIKSSSLALGENTKDVIETYDLTSREREILHMVLQGASNKDIEKKLFISASTVRNHIYNIYQKLSVKNRLELINRIARDAREKS